MHDNELKKIAEAVREGNNKTHNAAIYEGLRIAERIEGWWTTNHQLVEPRSVETLTEWTKAAIEELRSKLVPLKE